MTDRNSFIFYRSFFETGEKLRSDDELELFKRIGRYALNGDDTPSNSKIAELCFGLIKPVIDQNTKKYEGGKKGGRPRKQKESEKKPEPIIEKKSEEPAADVEAIPLNDGSDWQPTEKEFSEYCRLFPGVDVKEQFRTMRAWSLSNPEKRKTKRGVNRFVTSWLSREQDRATKRTGQQKTTIRLPDYYGKEQSETPAEKSTIEEIKRMQNLMKE